MLQVLQIYLNNIIRLLRRLIRLQRDYQVPLRVVVLGGDEMELGLVQGAMLPVQRYFRDQGDISWQIGWHLRTDAVATPETLRAYQALQRDPVPTLYVLTYMDRDQGGSRGAFAGQYAYTGQAPSSRLLAHEMGHILGLHHDSGGTLMAYGTEAKLDNATVTETEIRKMRDEARLYRN